MVLTAQWIAPVSRPLIESGAIVIADGRIVDVGPQAEVVQRHADAVVTGLGQVLIIPGLVNAHTHLELSDLGRGTLAGSGRIGGPSAGVPRVPGECGQSSVGGAGSASRPGSPQGGGFGETPLPLATTVGRPPSTAGFVGWLGEMIARSIGDAADVAARCSTATEHGIAQCLRFGVTCVGDITAQPAATRPVLARSPLRAVSFGEVRAMGARRSLLDERIAQATDGPGQESLRIGLSPHAPYSVEVAGYARCVTTARQGGIPLATHLAENPAEAEFLAQQTGPFRELWRALPWWDEQIPRFGGGPMRMANAVGLLDFPAVLAHVNCCDDAELELLARGRASVVYCPRTSAWFEHPRHRFREMLAVGINVALGTDSCASSPDLNLLEEARFVHRLVPEAPPETLLQMITLNGARALWWEDELGSLAPGKHADLAIIPVTSNEPLREILEAPLLPERVLVAGRVVGI